MAQLISDFTKSAIETEQVRMNFDLASALSSYLTYAIDGAVIHIYVTARGWKQRPVFQMVCNGETFTCTNAIVAATALQYAMS